MVKKETSTKNARRAEALRKALETGVGFIRVFEVAAIIGVSRQSVHEWVQKGKLPKPVRINDQVSGWPAAVIRDLIHGRKP